MRSHSAFLCVVFSVGVTLAPATPSPAAAGSTSGPPGRVLYSTNADSANISIFPVGPAGTPRQPAKLLATSSDPNGMVITADGRTAFVMNRGVHGVTPYSIGPKGNLTALSSPVATGGLFPFGITITPAGNLLFTSNIDSGTISTFAIHGDGTLSLVADPLPTGFDSPRGVAVTPDGGFLYVGHGRPTDHGPNALIGFAIDRDGTLREVSRTFTSGAGAQMAISPDGRLLYLAGQGARAVFGYHIAQDGTLTPVPGEKFAAGENTEGAAITPDGHHLYIASPGLTRPDTQRNVSAYTINDNGSLTPVTGSPFQAGAGPLGIVASPDGRHLYVSNVDSSDLHIFAIGTDGGLRQVARSPLPTGGITPGFQALTLTPNQGPAAAFVADVPRAGNAARFDASPSTDPDGHIAQFAWDFGDGTRLDDGGSNPTHAYRRPGTYTVTLTITDNETCSTSRVFTGSQTLCNGSAAAQASHVLTIQH
ncbi:beta-propeller fold lactonase family protein [Micromonospora sp. NPDC047738]|uniref:beta-propeller fold lactonase family protein n=1 Tax=Micromonospora sp. NPDC047738 TaxID=3155741 RepID=UPI00340A221A